MDDCLREEDVARMSTWTNNLNKEHSFSLDFVLTYLLKREDACASDLILYLFSMQDECLETKLAELEDVVEEFKGIEFDLISNCIEKCFFAITNESDPPNEQFYLIKLQDSDSEITQYTQDAFSTCLKEKLQKADEKIIVFIDQNLDYVKPIISNALENLGLEYCLEDLSSNEMYSSSQPFIICLNGEDVRSCIEKIQRMEEFRNYSSKMCH